MTLGMAMTELPASPAETDFLVGETGENDLAIPPGACPGRLGVGLDRMQSLHRFSREGRNPGK